MDTQMNRRNWIRSSAVLAGSLALFSDGLATAATLPGPRIADAPAFTEFMSEQEFLATVPADAFARLSANENPFGPSVKAKKAIADSIDGSFRYNFNYRELITRITKFEGLPDGTVTLSPGSTPFLKAGAAHFSKDGGGIVCGELTYDDLPSAAARLGGKVTQVPMTADYKLDLDAMEKAIDSTTKVVYIVNPNNPTATTVDAAKLKAFCARVSPKVPVFVDEAYIDYVDDPQGMSCIDCIKQGMNVVVIRTFSKLYGFAGLRMGYMVAQPAMLAKLSQYSDGMFSISGLSMSAAIASYQDKEFMSDVIIKAKASKAFLYETLKKEGYDYIPSDANFVLFPIKMEKSKFSAEMQKRNVSIRTWTFRGKDYCRVSIGTLDEMKIFAAAFTQIA